MADKTEDAQASLNAEGQGQAQAQGQAGLSASAKKTEKRTPKKLGKKEPEAPAQQPTPEPSPERQDEVMADAEPQQQQREVSRRRQSRGRGRKGGQESDTESVARSDVSAAGGGRRKRNRQLTQVEEQEQGHSGVQTPESTELEEPQAEEIPPGDYRQVIPQCLVDVDMPEDTDEYQNAVKLIQHAPNPPALPLFLNRSILNGILPVKDDNSVLTLPNHTVLNHLMTSSVKNGVLATSVTTRYKKKVCNVHSDVVM